MHNHISHLEGVITRNKWIFTVLVSVAFVTTAPLYLYTVNTSRMSYCIDKTERAIEAISRNSDETDYLYSVRRGYYECVARQGIDVRSVPSFDEVYSAGPTSSAFDMSDDDSFWADAENTPSEYEQTENESEE
jgi:hypothetical protein